MSKNESPHLKTVPEILIEEGDIYNDKFSTCEEFSRPITDPMYASSCFFKTSTQSPYKKVLIQITERCNLYCSHCFISANKSGKSISLKNIVDIFIPILKDSKVVAVSITGGEPFLHPRIIDIVSAIRNENMPTVICSNGTTLSKRKLQDLKSIGGVNINISLDGFCEDSHGVFRGDIHSFNKTIKTIEILSKQGLLGGILVTPNNLTKTQEYSDICEFAIGNNAKFIIINPLTGFGRGVDGKKTLAPPCNEMQNIENDISKYSDKIPIFFIRFQKQGLPLSGCEAGNIFYIFSNGDIAICPYLVFASRSKYSKYSPEEFIIGNISFIDNITGKLNNKIFKDRYGIGNNSTCLACELKNICGKGCPASIIANGRLIHEGDNELCLRIK